MVYKMRTKVQYHNSFEPASELIKNPTLFELSVQYQPLTRFRRVQQLDSCSKKPHFQGLLHRLDSSVISNFPIGNQGVTHAMDRSQ
jgi:hypothetical protein